MTDQRPSIYSAAPQSLGYLYQGRFALLKLLSVAEANAILVESDDDVEFVSSSGTRSLGSLKHKAEGDVLTNLSTDFWKSVRVWLSHYLAHGRHECTTTFMLFTTASLSVSSFLNLFADEGTNAAERARVATDVLEQSTAHTTLEVKAELAKLDEAERQDFFARIAIVDASPRITDIPQLIVDQHLRTVRRECRKAVYERLEGWWTDQLIRMLAKERRTAISGQEISDKLAALADEYKSDNLPITLRDRLPDEKIDASSDNRLFVTQLRALDLPTSRIQNAIVDYYRAFEQRSSWARESLLISGEVEEYERRLIDEWLHYKAVAFESIDASSDEVACKVAGKELYRWAEQQTSSLRIRERVTELYVVRGSFHMLANESPNPRVHWHPFFLKRLSELLGVAA